MAVTAPARRRARRASSITEPSAKRWWARPDGRVTALALALGAATIAAQPALLGYRPPALGQNVIPLWTLVLLFAATEGFVIHLRVRRGGHAMGLMEIPMVLGLLSTGPLLLLVTRLIGAAVGLAVFRRQRGVKLAFNLALFGAQVTVAAAVFRLVTGGSHTLGPREWLGAYAAMLVADLLSVILVTAVISLHDDPGEWRRLPSAMRGVPLAAVTTSIALVGALVVRNDVRAILLLAVVSFVAWRAYRAFVQLGQGHSQVEGLYAFTRALDGSSDAEEVGRTILGQARDQLRAQVAELIVPGSDGLSYIRLRMHGRGDIETSYLDRLPFGSWWTPAASGQSVLVRGGSRERRRIVTDHPADGIAVPMAMGNDTTGVLLVTDSLPDLRTFEDDHMRLFEALANHAGVSLARARLVDRLRDEVEEKEHLALHDPLTGLPNRRHFNSLLDRSLSGLIPAGGITAVMLMDLDRFKEVNDALGHDVGDALLHEVGVRLRKRLGDSGVVARLGGDEFAVLLPGIATRGEAIKLGNEITRDMEDPVTVGHLTLNTRASIGIAFAPEHGNDAKTLLQRADVAMYSAKETRSGERVYEPADDQNTPHRLALIADLRQAIERHELFVEFQPKIDPMSGIVTGAEALCRWHHPEHGYIPPDEFIPLAEHSGLIRPLTLHVLEVSLRRCAVWRRSGHDMHVAVNLSPNSLLDDTLPDVVSRLLGQTNLPAAALTLEITESSILADPKGALATLDRLHALGVKLAIDDFGTGYSSLGRLRELPIHEVKIDKSFIQRIAVDHRDRAVVRSALQLGHALDLAVVAEGVEDKNTYAHLTREGCNLVQGYYVSRPLPADEFERWLSRGASNNAENNVLFLRLGA